MNSAIEMEYFLGRSPSGEGGGGGQNGAQTPSDHTDNIAVVTHDNQKMSIIGGDTHWGQL